MGNAELKNVKFPEVGHFAANEQETWDERRRNGGA
jgi:hypothetical protein